MASIHKFETAEPIFKEAAFQDVNPSRGNPEGRRRGLDDRSEGCLFPYIDTSCSLKIPENQCGAGDIQSDMITIAPRVFTTMLALVTEYIRREKDLYTFPYLNDFLAKDKEKSFLVYKSKKMVQFMLDMGL